MNPNAENLTLSIQSGLFMHAESQHTMDRVKEFLAEIVAEYPEIEYVVLGKKYCGFCRKARNVLNERGAPYIYVDMEEKKELIDEIKGVTGMKTVPIIFTHSSSSITLIGGYTELVKWMAP